jgi:hypothetical protein
MTTLKKELKLPIHNYGPIALKILSDFKEFHKLPNDLKVPDIADTIESAISKILNIMISSMGESKKNEIIEEVEKYKDGMATKTII